MLASDGEKHTRCTDGRLDMTLAQLQPISLGLYAGTRLKFCLQAGDQEESKRRCAYVVLEIIRTNNRHRVGRVRYLAQ